MVHLYYGNGKGKTTAAIGLCVRAIGHRFNVLFAQFLKSEPTGEIICFEKLGNLDNIKVLRSRKRFPFTQSMTTEQQQEIIEIHNNIFKEAAKAYKESKFKIIVLDEIVSAYNYGFIDKNLIDEFLSNLNQDIELILTGHEPNQKFIDIADYASEIKKIKHPYDLGILGRVGVEL